MKLGIFDSGIGAIYCANKIRKVFNNIDIVVYMDYKNLPYGNKSSKELQEILSANFKFMQANDVDLIFIACNTLSCAYEEHKKNFTEYKVVTMFDFYDEIKEHIYSDVAFLGTTYTVNSPSIKHFLPMKHVELIDGKNLASCVECGDDKLIKAELEKIALPEKPLILGCTHFPLINAEITKTTGRPSLDPMAYLLHVFTMNNVGDFTNEVYINGDRKISAVYKELFKNYNITTIN